MGSFEEAQKKVAELVERFKLSPPANEASVRVQFLNPFFEALGWDVRNLAGHAEQYKEVVHEATVLVGAATKAPDYSFRVGGVCKFYVEAKNPSVSVKGDPQPAYQLRRYAWSAQLLLSILTDFQEFAVYDCYKKRPKLTDKASKHRILYLTFDQYPEKLREIWDIFAKESILKGSFDRLAEKARGTAEVDAEFLKEIEAWRNVIARNLALRNRGLTIDQLNEAVQRIIDRIIFLRMAEDRGIEHHGRLLALVNAPKIYERFGQLCQQADAKYNSGLFDFTADNWTLDLRIDDKVLKPIIKGIYYPDSPYEFSVIPPEILGNVYEQFLGKVIRLTKGHQARIEEKPEVKKAGGVYYTPRYIVDYIVQHTVGKLIEDRSPTQLKDLHVLDPACGSGSFLLGAYQCLLDHYLNWYVAHNPERRKKQVYRRSPDEWRLTTAERKRILTRHIYGVDIDPQAVEVSKLSLLLKVLEGESADTLSRQMKLFRERALPNLKDNIKCGNSLIGPDYLEGRLPGTIDSDELRRVNPFDWPAEFPHILGKKVPAKKRGFDAVIGNPPYVRPHNLDAQLKEYFWRQYGTFVKKSDLYCCFLERGLGLASARGRLGMIVSVGWLRLDSFEKLRRLLLHEHDIREIIEFRYNVFDRANVRTCILLVSAGRTAGNIIQVAEGTPKQELWSLPRRTIPQEAFSATHKSIFDLAIDPRLELVKEKMRATCGKLGSLFDISFGIKTADDSRFLANSARTPRHKPLLRGENIHRYHYAFGGEYVWYVPEKMKQHRRTARPGTAERFEQPKVLVRDTGAYLEAAIDTEHFYAKDVLIVTSRSEDRQALRLLLGILNSTLMRLYYETSFPTIHVQRDELASLPVPDLASVAPPDKKRCAHLTMLVERTVDLHKKFHAAKSERHGELFQRHIDATDRQIDQLVYELYGLTNKEIRIVETSAQTR